MDGERFAEVVVAEPGWLREEFDAIMSANLGPPAPPAPLDRRDPAQQGSGSAR
jgi:hypothetical protein